MSLEQHLQTAAGHSRIPQTINHALLNDLKVTFDGPSSAVQKRKDGDIKNSPAEGGTTKDDEVKKGGKNPSSGLSPRP